VGVIKLLAISGGIACQEWAEAGIVASRDTCHVSLAPYWDKHTHTHTHTHTHLLKPDKPVLIVYAIGYRYTCVGRKLAFTF